MFINLWYINITIKVDSEIVGVQNKIDKVKSGSLKKRR